MFTTLLPALLLAAQPLETPPPVAQDAAAHAVERYDEAQVAMLADLVRFQTVHREGLANKDNPEFRAFADYVRQRAEAFGLDFTDLGAVLVVGLGEPTSDPEKRLGIVTHGDVQPADPAKWAKSPFELDAESEPGLLVARGTEDNKAPIATALHAMRAIRELGVPLERRIELIISLTEESDWDLFREVLRRWQPPAVNVAIDSQYPVVVAEKGWGRLDVAFENVAGNNSALPVIESFDGGAFISQVPEDARIVIRNGDEQLLQRLQARASRLNDGVNYRVEGKNGTIIINAIGRAAHSSTPENGINALVHAAALLDGETFAESAAARAVRFTNSLLGTGMYGEQFGDAAYRHTFMGPLTVNLSTAKTGDDGVKLAINTRAPAGKAASALEADMRSAIEAWATRHDLALPVIKINLNDAYLAENAPQVEPLLAVFRHYTGQQDAKPISIGGATNAQLLPNGVNFGPSMPGVNYSGHSEHEFISREQMTLNLKMYTAMMVWLGMNKD